jgi:hypothetical protein
MNNLIRPHTGDADMPRRNYKDRKCKKKSKHGIKRQNICQQLRSPRTVLRSGTTQQCNTTIPAKPGRTATTSSEHREKQMSPPTQQQKSPPKPGQSVQATNINVNRSTVDMFKVVTVVQQIMTELNGAVSEEEKIMSVTKIVLNLMKQHGNESP